MHKANVRISRKSKSKHSTDESTHKKETEIEQNNTILQGELIPSYKHFRMSEISKIKIKHKQNGKETKKLNNFFELRKKRRRNRDKYQK